MMTLARLVGMVVPALKLINANEIGNLPDGISILNGSAHAIKRFDRLVDGTAVHIEDFAQIFGVYPDRKYNRGSIRGIAKVVGIETNENEATELVRRLTFNALIGNADMHLKNWSLIYPDRRCAALAPAYDLVLTIMYIPDEEFALNFSRTKRFDEFSEDELRHIASKANLREKLVIETARETVYLFRQHWQSEKRNLPLNRDWIAIIAKYLKSISLAN